MIRNNIARYLAGKKFVQAMMAHPADLSEFRERPTPRLIAGLVLMVLSFAMGWPAIAALSVLAVWWREPLIFIVGGPVAYALSCLVFFLGAWMARAPHYLNTLLRYAGQSILKKLV